MRKTYSIIFALFIIVIANSCSFTPIEDFKNPADPESESYQGYMVVDDPNQIIAETKEDLYLSELTFVVSKVVGAQAYQLQIANDDSFSDIAYENSFADNILKPDVSRSHLRRYWRVRAKVDDAWGNWGSIKSFIYLHPQTLYFESQGGNTPKPVYKEITDGSQYGSLPTVTRNGYEFDGWWTEPGGAGIQITSDSIVSTSSGHIVYAKWVATVFFDNQGATTESNPTTKTVVYISGTDKIDLLPIAPLKTGYSFDGWWTQISGGGISFTAETAVTSDITVHAKWSANTNTAYKVEHYKQDLSESGYTKADTDSLTGTTDSQAIALKKEYNGFTENTSHAGRIASGNIAPDGSLILRLYYDRTMHVVSFDENGGSSVADITNVRYGVTISKPTNPIRDYYMFLGWYKDDDLTTAWDFNLDTVRENITLYAKWKEYQVRDIGPSGGYIFYDKGSCSDGWRFLEVAPKGWSGAAEDSKYVFGYYRTSENGTNLVVGTETGIGNGKENTQKLVAAMGSAAHTYYVGSTTTAEYAAKMCADYRGGGHDDWFLPSKDELDLMRQNLAITDGILPWWSFLGGLCPGVDWVYYWSSSENYAYSAWTQYFLGGDQISNDRNYEFRVRPVRAF